MLQRDRRAGQRGVGDQFDQRAFQFPHVGFGFGGDEDAHVVRQRDAFHLGLLVQDGHLGFEVGRLNVGHQAPFEARAQALHQTRECSLGGESLEITICF